MNFGGTMWSPSICTTGSIRIWCRRSRPIIWNARIAIEIRATELQYRLAQPTNEQLRGPDFFIAILAFQIMGLERLHQIRIEPVVQILGDHMVPPKFIVVEIHAHIP